MPSPLLIGYRGISALAVPFVARKRVDKLRKAGQSVPRAHEILGHATDARRLGPLVWFHAASVGEAKSCLPLLAAMRSENPNLQFLITTVTPTSAEVLASRLPPGTIHQFAPLDAKGPVTRFLNHWKPDLGIFIESEIWPNILHAAAKADVPMALVNARMSVRSARRWLRVKHTARGILGKFGLIHCQDRATADALYAMGLRHARQGVNLKSIVPPPQVDPLEQARMKATFQDRPIWTAVSTHPGEEQIILEAHARLRVLMPNAALILVPRHPERAPEILALGQDHTIAQRSVGQDPAPNTSVYLADTIGETDLWFSLAPVCCLCGSFTNVGGHTPFEPASAGTALVHGPHYANHAEAYAKFQAANASIEVGDAPTLAAAVDLLLRNPTETKALARAALPLAAAGQDALGRLARECCALGGLTETQTDA